LEGKKAIVTGGSRGIGAAIVRAFIEQGADVLVNFNSSERKALELVRSFSDPGNGARAVPFRADITKISEIKTMVQKAEDEFGRIDVLVNNAGIIYRKNFLTSTEAEFDRIMAVNVKGPFFCSQEVAPLMIKQGKGKIINISSISGLAQPSGLSYPDYAASKAAIIGLTRSLAVNLGPEILVNAVAPGTIPTDMTALLSEAQLAKAREEAFTKRLGAPEDIANACVFFASDESDFITGEVLAISGGRGMR
jgi:3-oxoacyl-[acyl-carrier protein] reductase